MGRRLFLVQNISILLLALLFLGCDTPISLKKRISEGKIVYKIKYPKLTTSSSISVLLPSEMTIYFKDNSTKSVMKGALNFYAIEMLSQAGSDTTYTFLRVMDKKVFIASPNANGIFLFEQLKDSKIELIDGSEKDIIGFRCKKALLKMDTKGVAPIEAFYTNMIKIKDPNRNTPFHDIPGVLVEFDVMMKNLHCTFTATEILPLTLNEDKFALSNKYERITETEMKTIMTNLMQ